MRTVTGEVTGNLAGEQRGLEPQLAAAEFRHERLCAAMASIAHDLKSPLGVVAGYTDLLLTERIGLISSRQRSVLEQMQQQGQRLQLLVEDFLTLGALEAGTMQCRFAMGDIGTSLQEMCALWEPRFRERGIALYHVRNASLPPFPLDNNKVQRVVSNLLENATKYVPAGGSVTVQAELYRWERRRANPEPGREFDATQLAENERRRRHFEGPNAVRVRVTDNGPGIAAEYHLEIFDEFFRLPEASQTADGTGLGLSIARRLIHACGGKIWVESELGAGCNFHFLLPVQTPGGKTDSGLRSRPSPL